MENKKMTIFYSQNTGNIEGIFSDEISFEDAFFSRYEDVQSYCVRAIIDFDLNLLTQSFRYKINLETMALELKEEYKPIQLKL